jgi:[acyl-carrier-protein] S-malonyltransferase
VTSGAYDFETAILHQVSFTGELAGVEKIGSSIGVATREASFSQDDFDWLRKNNIDYSRLSSRFLNIGVSHEEMALIQEQSNKRRWSVMNLLNYPVHSKHVLSFIEPIEELFLSQPMGTAKISMLSSVNGEPLDNAENIKKDILYCASNTIQWEDAIRNLYDRGVREFINIGPCRSLSKIFADYKLDATVSEPEAFIGSSQGTLIH